MAEDFYHDIINSIDDGFCVFDMIYDADGKPYDLRYVEVNPAFENKWEGPPSSGKLPAQFFPSAKGQAGQPDRGVYVTQLVSEGGPDASRIFVI